ncbi:MAG TPA: cyclase family protein [Gaiellaceae bacterium]|jgi:kynurenine formamidase
MTSFVRLSYDIHPDHPVWPGNFTYRWEPASSIAAGGVANHGVIRLGNHFGSHLDAPNHFNDEGRKIAHVPIDRFVYERPRLVDVPKGERELVERAELEAHADAVAEADLLLVRTGWGAARGDPSRYASEGPGVSPDACEYLIEQPGLKAIALDCISLASYHRLDPEGIDAHRILCGVGRGDRYVIIIEDVDLAAYPADARRVYAVPLFPAFADSSPCTVFAEVG